MQFEIESLAFGVLIPALAGGGLALIAALARHRGRFVPAACGSVAVACGFALAWWLFDWTPLVPEEFWQWQLTATLAAAAVGMLMGCRRAPAALRILACAAVALGGAWRIVPDGEEGWAFIAEFRAALIGSLAMAVFFVWIAVDRASRRPQRLTLWWLAACGMTGGVVLFQSGNTKLAQLSGALGAAVIGAAAVCTWRPNADFVRGAAGPLAATLAGLSVSGYVNTYNDIPRACFLIVMVSPLAAISGEWLAPRARGWIRSLISGAAVVGLLSLALALAFSIEQTDPANPEDEWSWASRASPGCKSHIAESRSACRVATLARAWEDSILRRRPPRSGDRGYRRGSSVRKVQPAPARPIAAEFVLPQNGESRTLGAGTLNRRMETRHENEPIGVVSIAGCGNEVRHPRVAPA